MPAMPGADQQEEATPGASARSMRRVVVGMICLLALALGTVGVLKVHETRHINTLIGYSEDDTSWAVHQLQTEQLRLEAALLAAAAGDLTAREEAALRYETYASRHTVISTGIFRRKLDDLPAYTALAAAFNRLLSTHDPLMADGLQHDEIAPLLAGVRALRQPVNDLVAAENALQSNFESASRVEIAHLREASLATVAVLGIVLLCFAGYALAVLRRAQNFELALSRSEHVLRGALREAQSANAAKSAFLANMSHELRTPLNAVIGFSEFLELSAARRLDERQRGYLGDIRASGRHLLEILSTILELSKLEAGKVELQVDEVPTGSMLDECVRMIAGRAAQRGIVIERADLGVLPPIKGDATRLRQIFLNLLSNAVKYSHAGGKVRIAGATERGFVGIRIADQGIGMESADIEVALRPFERLRNAETANQEGVGLGLTIVKTLVDIHGGQLAIESESGRGTTVTVHLPAGTGRPETRVRHRQAANERLALEATATS